MEPEKEDDMPPISFISDFTPPSERGDEDGGEKRRRRNRRQPRHGTVRAGQPHHQRSRRRNADGQKVPRRQPGSEWQQPGAVFLSAHVITLFFLI